MIPLDNDSLEDDDFHEYLETISKYYNIHTGTLQEDKNNPKIKYRVPYKEKETMDETTIKKLLQTFPEEVGTIYEVRIFHHNVVKGFLKNLRTL